MNAHKPNTHGGPRKGAGRPTADGAKDLRQVPVMLAPESIKRAKELGEGNIKPSQH